MWVNVSKFKGENASVATFAYPVAPAFFKTKFGSTIYNLSTARDAAKKGEEGSLI